MYIVSRKSKKRKIILLIKNLKTLNCLTIKNYTKKILVIVNFEIMSDKG